MRKEVFFGRWTNVPSLIIILLLFAVPQYAKCDDYSAIQQLYNQYNPNPFLTVPNHSKLPIEQQWEYNVKRINEGSHDLKKYAGKKEIVSEKERLLKYLHRISGSKTISGIMFDVVRVEDLRTLGIQIIQSIVGPNVLPGLLTFEMGNSSTSPSEWHSFVREVTSSWKSGYLVRIIWNFRYNPLMRLNIFKRTSNSITDYNNWQSLVEEGGTLNTEWKKQLDTIAPILKQIQSSGVIPICDFLPYFNFNSDFLSSLWMGRPGINGSAKMYQVTHDYLTKHHNLHSLIWTWSLANPYSHDDETDKKNRKATLRAMKELKEYWPGNKYVDVVSARMRESEDPSLRLYTTLLDIVNRKPISLDASAPSMQFLNAQPRWVWFSTEINRIGSESLNVSRVKAAFHNPLVINKENIDFFNNSAH